jgi:MFS family permease
MKRFLSNEAFAVLKVKNFRLYLFYRFFLTVAIQMMAIIVSWQLYNLTKSVLSLGFIGLTEVVPQVSIALFAGHYIDIWNRKKIISSTTVLLILGAAILLVYSIPSLHCFSLFGTLPVYITIFLTGLARGIISPAQTAILGQLVPRELYPNAATWNSANWQVAAVAGPAIGGLVYGFFGVVPAYSTVLVLLMVSFFLILDIKYVKLQTIKTNSEGIFLSIREGIHFVFKNQILLGAFALDMFAVLFGGAVAMLPVFASDILKTGPEGLGLLRACPAIGAIIMSVYLMFRPPVGKTGKYLLICVTGFGLCMIFFALSINFYLSAALLVLSGIFDNVSVVIRGTILQLFTPDEMRGRVAAVNSIFIGSSNELGAFESGVAAKIMGLIPSVIFGGAMTLVVVSVTTKVSPVLRKLSLRKSILK